MEFEDGIPEGVSEDFFENGQLYRKRNYVNGKLDGDVEVYYENGQLEESQEYEDG